MSRHGLKEVDLDAYGLVMDMTEQFMKDLVSDLIAKSRVRR